MKGVCLYMHAEYTDAFLPFLSINSGFPYLSMKSISGCELPCKICNIAPAEIELAETDVFSVQKAASVL